MEDIHVHAGNQPQQPDWDQCCIRATVASLQSARRNIGNAMYSIGNIKTKRGVDGLYQDAMKMDDDVAEMLQRAENIATRIDAAAEREREARDAAVDD